MFLINNQFSFIILLVLWVNVACLFNGLLFFVGKLPGNPFINMVYSSIIDIASYIIAHFITKRLFRWKNSVLGHINSQPTASLSKKFTCGNEKCFAEYRGKITRIFLVWRFLMCFRLLLNKCWFYGIKSLEIFSSSIILNKIFIER